MPGALVANTSELRALVQTSLSILFVQTDGVCSSLGMLQMREYAAPGKIIFRRLAKCL